MKPTPTQKGLITGALMIIASAFSSIILKNPVESYYQFIVYTIFCAGIVWCLLAYSKTAVDKKTFKDYFSVGFKTFIVITLLMTAYSYIYFSYHTEFRDNKIAENNRLLILEGNHLPNEIAENTKQLKKMFMPLMLSSSIFRYLIVGALVTAIAAGFISSRNKVAPIR